MLATLHAAGLSAMADGGRLIVTPVSAITPAMRTFIRENRAAILDALADDRKHCFLCSNLNRSRCSVRGFPVVDHLPRRCLDYLPSSADPDRRPGRVRWSFLEGTHE